MDEAIFDDEVARLIEAQGGEDFVLAAFAELSIQFTDEVPPSSREFILGRIVALWEESQC